MNHSKRHEHEMDLLEFVQQFTKSSGFPPSTREIAEALGFKSVESIHRMLTHLRAIGRVTWEPNKARTLKVLNPTAPSTDH